MYRHFLCHFVFVSSTQSTALYWLKLGEEVSIGLGAFNVEVIYHNDAMLTMWDLCGLPAYRENYQRYYDASDAVIYFIDCALSGRDRLQESKELLRTILADLRVKNLPLLVFANKQDLNEEALSVDDIELLFESVLSSHNYHIQASSSRNTASLKAGLAWLVEELKRARWMASDVSKATYCCCCCSLAAAAQSADTRKG